MLQAPTVRRLWAASAHQEQLRTPAPAPAPGNPKWHYSTGFAPRQRRGLEASPRFLGWRAALPQDAGYMWGGEVGGELKGPVFPRNMLESGVRGLVSPRWI